MTITAEIQINALLMRKKGGSPKRDPLVRAIANE